MSLDFFIFFRHLFTPLCNLFNILEFGFLGVSTLQLNVDQMSGSSEDGLRQPNKQTAKHGVLLVAVIILLETCI